MVMIRTFQDNRLTKGTMKWKPKANRRHLGHPNPEWKDDIQKQVGVNCRTLVMDRKKGGRNREGLYAAVDGNIYIVIMR